MNEAFSFPFSVLLLELDEAPLMRTEQPKMIYLKDYQVPDYLIDETHLTFELFEDHTLVHAQLMMRRNPEAGSGLPPLVLDGQQLVADGRQIKRHGIAL